LFDQYLGLDADLANRLSAPLYNTKIGISGSVGSGYLDLSEFNERSDPTKELPNESEMNKALSHRQSDQRSKMSAQWAIVDKLIASKNNEIDAPKNNEIDAPKTASCSSVDQNQADPSRTNYREVNLTQSSASQSSTIESSPSQDSTIESSPSQDYRSQDSEMASEDELLNSPRRASEMNIGSQSLE
jgi:hypothetical protein